MNGAILVSHRILFVVFLTLLSWIAFFPGFFSTGFYGECCRMKNPTFSVFACSKKTLIRFCAFKVTVLSNKIMSRSSQSTDSTETETNDSYRINPDHIFRTDVVSFSDVVGGTPNEGLAQLPPSLTTIETQTVARRIGNRGSFKPKNTIRKDSAEAMREFDLDGGNVKHPVNDPRIRKVLQQTNLRRVPSDGSELCTLFRNKMIDFLTEKSENCCYSPRHNQYTKCTCVKELLQRNSGNIEAVSDIVTSYYQFSYKERFTLFSNKVFEIMDRKITPRLKSVTNMKFRGRLFGIRGKFDASDDSFVDSHTLCMYGYLSIYGIGPKHLDSMKSKYEMSTFDSERNLAHGLTRKKSNNAVSEEVLVSLGQFFNELKDEADDYASRQVRSHVGGNYLRDNELDGVRLPPSYTKTGMYRRWCHNQGWITNTGADRDKGYKTFRVRPFDESEFPPTSTPSPICSRECFMSYWRNNFPNIKIAPSSKDTCGKCWQFKRQIQSQDRRMMQQQAADDEDNGNEVPDNVLTDLPDVQLNTIAERTEDNDRDDNDLIAGDDTTETEVSDTRTVNTESILGSYANTADTFYGINTVNSTTNNSNKYVELYSNTISAINSESGSPNLGDEEIDNICNLVANIQLTEQETTVCEWKQHCDDFTAQRRYVQALSLNAKEDLNGNIPFQNRRFAYCSDYCQNMDLPHFGSEQPGETYYYSPLNINCFGVTDLSTDVLDAFLYHEGEGKKGGNNVCSLLFKKLKQDGLIDLSNVYGPAKQLSLVFDNCAGQNKNRMVLRFAQFLIDSKIFNRVEIVFLIMGHTKNICDRRFKDLKNKFHHRNIYTMKHLVEVLSTDNEQYVKVIRVDSSSFHNWDGFLTTKLSYRKAIKDCSKFHCFFYDSNQKGAVFKKHTILDTKFIKETINKQYDNQTWINSLSELSPDIERCPGIADIKQVELFTKWRKVIPSQYQDEICPRPEDNVLLKVKKQKAKKAKDKLASKKQQLDQNNTN